MPRYFLHLHNGRGMTPDEEGLELAGLSAARSEAVEGIRSLLADELRRSGKLDLRGRIDIADAGGALVARIPFTDAIELHLEEGS